MKLTVIPSLLIWGCTTFLFAGSALGQSQPLVIRSSAVLASALVEGQLQAQQSETDYLSQNPLLLPWLDELELRYGPDDLYLNEQRVAIRLATNGWRSVRQQRSIHQLEWEMSTAEQRVLLHEKLMERYRAACDLYFLQALMQAQNNLVHLYDTTRQAYGFLLSAGAKVDLLDFVDAEEDGYSAQAELRKYQAEHQRALSLITQWLPLDPKADLRLDTFIGTEHLAATALTIAAQTQLLPTPELAIKAIDTRLSQAEWQLEKTKQYNLLSFFQLDYRQPQEPFTLQRDLSARIGLKVPIPGGARIKQRERALQVLQAQHRHQWAQSTHQQSVAQQTQTLHSLIEQQNSLLADHQKSSLHRLLTDPAAYTYLEGVDVLRLRLLRQKQTINQLELAYKTAQAYLELLDISGAASAQPLRNYLDPKLSPLPQ